ncbi:MAG TPA: hypothetical protein VN667_16120 [Burkholderiales bacterium]|nr:hypothetical protein [Burkholderiales bacterium]
MRKRPLPRPLEKALRQRLLDAPPQAVQSATPDLFPVELEAALDRAVQTFRAERPARRSRPTS